MKIIKHVISTALLFCCYLQVCAQTGITGIWPEAQNTNIAVHYTLVTRQPVDLNLQYSNDDGKTWHDCKSVTGDLKNQRTGSKTILWDCRKDGFESGSLLFKVVAPKAANYRKNCFGLDLGYGQAVGSDAPACVDFGIRYTRNFPPISVGM